MESKIKEIIDRSNSILLLTHESPDGDAIGSVLSFYHYLKSINKSVDMVVLDIPKIFDFLPSINKIVDNTNDRYDLGIVFDCSSRERIGQNDDLLTRCNYTLCIDHHISNTNYCNINYVKGDISSCCQVIYYLLKAWNVSINDEIGIPLISGVLTDTNGFSNNDVDSETFNMASDLKEKGINIDKPYRILLLQKSIPQYKLMKLGMDRLEFLCDGKIAFTYLLKEDFKLVGASLGEHEGIVDIGRSIDGVEISIFIREDDGWTISLRSSGKYPVNEIAAKIGGGGHFMASGAKLNGSFEEIKETLINMSKEVLFK